MTALTLILTAIAGLASQTTVGPEIPARFHGDWSVSLAYCHDRESGQNLSIDATSITYFEAGDDVIVVASLPNGGVSVLADHEDYDGMERVHRILVLSDDNQKLSFIIDDAPGYVVVRCPQGNSDVR